MNFQILAFVAKSRAGSDDEKPGDFRKISYDVQSYSVSEVLLVRILTQVLKQHYGSSAGNVQRQSNYPQEKSITQELFLAS